MNIQQDPTVKIIIVGDSGVGKTSLFTSFADQSYTGSHIPTIGVDFRLKRIQVGDQTVKLQIWDTAGLERYRALTANYFRGADVVCLVYDITCRESFANLKNWIRIIQQTTDEDFMYLVVGNKMDLTAYRMVSDEEGALFASSISAGFFETSAKTFLHLTDVFLFMAQEVLKQGVKQQSRVLVMESEPKPKTKRFCGWF
jgi:small GTP-binding protein